MRFTSLAIITLTTTIGTAGGAEHGAAPAGRLEFEVASVKRNTSGADSIRSVPLSNAQFAVANISLKVLIAYAFNIQGSDISGGPGWVASDKYDIVAKAAETNPSVNQYRSRVRTLLKDRFMLAFHWETRERSVFMLVAAKSGPRLAEESRQSCMERAASQDGAKSQAIACGTFFTGPSSLDARRTSMIQFASTLSMILGKPVIDKTGFVDSFDIHLEFNPEGTNLTRRGLLPLDAAQDSQNRAKPSIFTALGRQAGLRLESASIPVTILVIDHVEQLPSEN